MNVKELIKNLQLVEDDTLEVLIEPPYYYDDSDINYWIKRIEVSNTGDSGYEVGGEVRLIGID